MNTPDSIINAASKNQHDASSPQQSVWVSANAGTGKTRVLTNRILRLLIDGAKVTDILGVTYTRAAAAEMRNRLYENLTEWAVIGEAELIEKIQNIGVHRPSRKQLDRARRLFAEMLDAPIPIRIETVHAFAQSVLRRFPVEANIQPYFEMATDDQTRTLKSEAITDVMASTNDRVQQSLRYLAEVMTEEQLISSAAAMFNHRDLLDRVTVQAEVVFREVYDVLGAQDAAGRADARVIEIKEAAINTDDRQLKALAAACDGGTKTDQGKAQDIRDWLALDGQTRIAMLDDYCNIFLTKSGEPRKNIATQKVMTEAPTAEYFAKTEAARLIDALAQINGIHTAKLTTALYVVAAEMSDGYRVRKNNNGLMDYDDLISKTAELFRQNGGVSWVLYKLDKGIQHILIDEAQDTSPQQWKILSSLVKTFFDDTDNEEELPRSLFSVGDYKQSIYSFQGARPDLFVKQKEKFKTLARQNKKPFSVVELDTSFRTVAPILNVVDAVMWPDVIGLDGIGDAAVHQVSRLGDAGFVEILDPINLPDNTDAEAYTPYRNEDTASPEAVLAKTIVSVLKGWIGKRFLPSRGRMMRAGDVLILLRKRRGFYQILDREIRRAGLSLAGADRLKLNDDIAVMDLMALGAAMLLPEDDLTLAGVLKSPLFGLIEDDLFALAYDRGGARLIQRLAMATGDQYTRAHQRFNTWLGHAETQTPYEFYQTVLSPEVRENFIKRLGMPVVDVIAEFLEAARSFEDTQAPSLQGFLAMMTTSELEIKREGNTKNADEIRIMTIHGAKGLESPVVILADTLRQTSSPILEIVPIRHGDAVYPVKPVSAMVTNNKVQDAKARQKQEGKQEDNRLLYVAMTRAEDGLLIAGFEAKHKRTRTDSWYQHIRNAVENFPASTPRKNDDGGGDGVVLECEQTAEVTPEKTAPTSTIHHDLPGWLHTASPSDEKSPQIFSPSQQQGGGDYIGASPVGQERKLAMLLGSLTHRLLEILPPLNDDARRRAIKRTIASYAPHQLDEAAASHAASTTLRLINDTRLKDIFSQNARAEVPVSGMVQGYVISGVIDRIVIDDAAITIIDFKTGQPPKTDADIPSNYISQLALYTYVLRQIWPEKTLHAGLIFTEDASIHWLDDQRLAASISTLIRPIP